MDVRLRTDSPAPDPGEICYPAKPDTRGNARKTWQGYTFSFGKHNTPESWALFGEWRRHLIDTGEALKTADVRQKLIESGAFEPIQRKPAWRVHATYSAAMITVALLACVTTRIVSSPNAAQADEFTTSLTDEEKKLIEGYRRQDDRLAVYHASQPHGSREARIAARMAAMMEAAESGKEAEMLEGL